MRHVWRTGEPPVHRVLLVESGSRNLLESLIPVIRSRWDNPPIDLVTCYGGAPQGLEPEATTFHVANYRSPAERKELIHELRSHNYSIVAIICSGEPVMTKWKWLVALRVPAKVMVLNENGDFFWLDRAHWSAIRHFALFRMGLAGAGATRTLGRLLIFPFSVLFLLLYACFVHARRAIRRAIHI